MKKILLPVLMLFAAVTVYAQTTPPQYINYQAIVRKSGGEINANKKVRIEFRILKYPGLVEITERSEFHIQTTSDLGLVSVQIGKGTLILGKPFSEINWRDSLKLGVTIYNDIGQILVGPITQDFASTPYALYALKSGSTIDNAWTIIDNNIYRANGNVGIGLNIPREKLHIQKGNIYTEDGTIEVYKYLQSNMPALKVLKHSNLTYPNQVALEVIGGVTDVLPQRKFKIFTDGNDPFTLKASFDGDFYINKGLLDVYKYDDLGNRSALTVTKHSNLTYPNQTALKIVGGVTDLRAKAFSIYTSDGDPFTLKAKMQGNMIIEEGHLNVSGNVDIGGNIYSGLDGSFRVVEIRGGGDIVEKFKSKETLEAGILVTIDEKDINNYKTTDKAYQKGIVGIVSGANGVKHGMLLEQDDALAGNTKVAIAGRVYVKATAQNGAIKAGDLLTSSDKAGYAMKVTSRKKAFGSVVGKALTSLDKGEGYVLVLVGLQ